MTHELVPDPPPPPVAAPDEAAPTPEAAARFRRRLARLYERVFRDVLEAFDVPPAIIQSVVADHGYGFREPSALLFSWTPMEHVAGLLLAPEYEDLRLARNEKLRAIRLLANELDRAYRWDDAPPTIRVDRAAELRRYVPAIRQRLTEIGARFRTDWGPR